MTVTNGEAGSYPGAEATSDGLLRLAAEYQKAAQSLVAQKRKAEPISLAPCRFMTLHAIELYLNAFLLMKGDDHKAIRKLGHDLPKRAEQAQSAGLPLRKGTLSHLKDGSNREYLVTRYSPELPATLPQINRLMATLDDVAKKVRASITPQAVKDGGSSAVKVTAMKMKKQGQLQGADQ